MSARTKAMNVVAALLAALLCGGAAVAAEPAKPDAGYRIKFLRPAQVGQTFKCTLSGREVQEQSMTMPGQPPQTQRTELVYELSGVKEITQVDEKGRATGLEFTVETCVKIDGDRRTDAAAKGTVVTVTAEGEKKEIRAKDPSVTLSPEAAAILNNLYPAEIDQDAAFGTDQPRKIGDSWPVNGELIAKEFSRLMGAEGAVKKENVTGRMSLAGLKTVQGIECLDVRLDVLVSGFAPPDPSAKVEKAELSISMTGALPLDESLPMLGGSQSMAMSMAMKIATGEGPDADAQMSMKQTRTHTEIPLSKGK